jgi:hypothetical protein
MSYKACFFFDRNPEHAETLALEVATAAWRSG